ncbi:Znf706 [Columba livia]|nr:Znf706 [Columba livia]
MSPLREYPGQNPRGEQSQSPKHCCHLHLRKQTGKSPGQTKDEEEKKVEIKVSGAAGACANTQGDSAANDEMSVQKDLKVESQTGKPDEKVEKADMARGQQKIQSQQKNAKKQAEQKKKQGHDQKAAAKAALIYTCTVCRTQMPDPKTFKQHFESKHPKTPLPPELADVQA